MDRESLAEKSLSQAFSASNVGVRRSQRPSFNGFFYNGRGETK